MIYTNEKTGETYETGKKRGRPPLWVSQMKAKGAAVVKVKPEKRSPGRPAAELPPTETTSEANVSLPKHFPWVVKEWNSAPPKGELKGAGTYLIKGSNGMTFQFYQGPDSSYVMGPNDKWARIS